MCQYPDAAPLLLQGDAAPLAAVAVIAATHGTHALVQHPAMTPVTAAVPRALPGA